MPLRKDGGATSGQSSGTGTKNPASGLLDDVVLSCHTFFDCSRGCTNHRQDERMIMICKYLHLQSLQNWNPFCIDASQTTSNPFM